eukprot:TRINITY_DN36169_c0_g1_i1.p1 TRINITY_DN36169_c0_g1~~TRINITY_DN36169_c0_g1_i1.p1  ORF type:complete len:217 (-),score=38.86 TRINITY_DN36169_c0_g1_i1:34-684(-)
MSISQSNSKLVSVKVVLLGDASVGKSSLVNRLVQNSFAEHLPSTVGAAYQTITIKTEEKDVSAKLEIWDTAGQERYRSLAPMYYRGAQAAVVVFDLTNESSLNSAGVWIEELKVKSDDKLTVAVVGNKCDKTDEIAVSQESAEEFVRGQGAEFFMQTSAKSGHNVHQLFEQLANATVKALKKKAQQEPSSNGIPNDVVKDIGAIMNEDKPTKGCCK